MIEDAQAILEYLPRSYRTAEESEYISFLWESFESNYQNEKYQFAFIAYHLLFMSAVYFKIWQIRNNKETEFKTALVGFRKDQEKDILKATSPFTLSLINEKTVFRFFKLIGFDNKIIEDYCEIITERNKIAHSSGHIFYNNQEALDKKIEEILTLLENIQTASENLVSICFNAFLADNFDEQELWGGEEHFEQYLIKPYYFSNKDIAVCLNTDTTSMSEHKEIKRFFDYFKKIYSLD